MAVAASRSFSVLRELTPLFVSEVEVVAARVTLGSGKNSLFQEGGTALVVHADPDNGRTDPTGNAGARLACGVITK